MPLISVPEVVSLATREQKRTGRQVSTLLESVHEEQRAHEDRWFDIFLSHSYADKKVIYGTMLMLSQYGHSVYVDWIVDPELSRGRITKKNADVLRWRMDHSFCLLYVPSESSSRSVWMPWELGYMDGKRGRVAILPLTRTKTQSNTYAGREYLGLYPYIRESPTHDTAASMLWVATSEKVSSALPLWIEGEEPHRQVYLES